MNEVTLARPADAPDAADKKAEKQAYENNKLHKRLCRLVGQAIGDFNMIEEGDKIMVVAFGQGVDTLVFEVTAENAKLPKRRGGQISPPLRPRGLHAHRALGGGRGPRRAGHRPA